MTYNIAINGFGRIGRLVLRAICEQMPKEFKVVAINDLASVETNAYLFKYDSVHGTYTKDVTHTQDSIDVGFGPIAVFKEADPAKLPWDNLKIDLVMECSGVFTERNKAELHIMAGAKRVLISAPATDVDLTVVYGVNHQEITANHTIISNASCTTNCFAPLAAVLHKAVGIQKGYMTTIHAYTGDQRLVDTNHKDLRRSRAAALSMIPTSTGAARAVGLVLPELNGKIDGTSIRVPAPNVSVVDFTFLAKRTTTAEELNEAITKASQGFLKGILEITVLPLVSCDFNHSPASSICDLTQTQVIDHDFCRVLSWYDNEWGFSNRMIDTTKEILKKI